MGVEGRMSCNRLQACTSLSAACMAFHSRRDVFEHRDLISRFHYQAIVVYSCLCLSPRYSECVQLLVPIAR